MRELTEKIDFFLNERRRTTKTEMTRAKRVLKIEKSRDVGLELYDDFLTFLSTYLNTMESKELVKYKIINRKKAEELISAMSSSVPEFQAILEKLHFEPDKFVTRYWNLKDMKITIQDAVDILLKGKKVETPVAAVETAPEKKETEPGPWKNRGYLPSKKG